MSATPVEKYPDPRCFPLDVRRVRIDVERADGTQRSALTLVATSPTEPAADG